MKTGTSTTENRNRYSSWLPVLLAVSFCLLYLSALDRPVLVPWQESGQAERSRQLAATENSLRPSLDGNRSAVLAPLHQWSQTASFELLGTSALAARLPTALAGLLLIASFYLAARKALGPGTAASAAAILGSSLLFAQLSRLATGDILASLPINGMLLCFWNGFERHRQGQPAAWSFWGGYGCGGLAVLAAGPAGLLLPTALLLVYSASIGKPMLLFRNRYFWKGLLLLILVGYSWYLPLALSQPGGLTGLAALVRQSHQGPWFADANWFPEVAQAYPLLMAAGLLPWLGYLPFGLARTPLFSHRQPQARLFRLGLLTIAGAATVSIWQPGAAPLLVLVSMPWLALIIALGFRPGILKPGLLGVVATSTTGLLFASIGLALALSPWLLAYLPDLLNDTAGPVAILAAEPPSVPGAWLTACLPIGCGLVLLSPSRPQGGVQLYTTLLFSGLILCSVCFFSVLPYLDRVVGEPPIRLAQEADRRLPEGDPIVVVGLGNHPALEFASGRRVVSLQNHPEQGRGALPLESFRPMLGITDWYQFNRLHQQRRSVEVIKRDRSFVLFEMEPPNPAAGHREGANAAKSSNAPLP